jgi:hypothetical protein
LPGTKTLTSRFHSGYKTTPNGCWEWQRSKDKDGYGYIKKDQKTTKAHRVSYELHYGPIENGLWVLHRCDNPSCVNPEHLWLGTAKDNSDDMIAKGRAVAPKPNMKGERNPNSRLTAEDVQWIRDNYRWGRGPEFAKKFGVIPIMINRIVRGEAWKF